MCLFEGSFSEYIYRYVHGFVSRAIFKASILLLAFQTESIKNSQQKGVRTMRKGTNTYDF